MALKTLLILPALLAGAALTVTGCATYKEKKALEDSPPLGQFLEVDGHRVHAWVQGTGPDLVLIHGSSGNLRDFTHSFTARLTDRFRVIAFDRPGLGYTPAIDPEGDSLRDQAALLQKAAEQLGAERPIVLGQSLGGAVALAWATYTPDKLSALVTVSGVSHPWETPLSTYYKVLSNPVGQRTVVPALTAFVPDGVVENAIKEIFDPFPVPEGYAEYIGPGLTLKRSALRANADQRERLLEDVRAQQPLYGSRITVPVEVVHGDADDTVWYDLHVPQMEAQVDDVRVTRIEGAGHMPHHTHPEPVVAAVDSAAARAGLR